jgi:hypothetical protein
MDVVPDYVPGVCRIMLTELEFKQVLRGLKELDDEHGLIGTLADLYFEMYDSRKITENK